MKLSSRSRYGFRAILELAVAYGEGPIQIKTIADREDISNKYLEQLIAMLKAAGLVRSVRGPRGGYTLAKPPSEIRLDEVFSTLEGPLVAVDCLEHATFCSKCTDCVTRRIWSQMQDAVLNVLRAKTLQDMVDMAQGLDKNGTYHI
ncbi:MAG: Rrf2 family transcriptional regulator [Sedimentisphaerales bacterium]|nr:Rrf2 family transcriptional regulator [Sedimentisphaerales bacterium]